ncbi:MAG: TRAP transporter fused permease subunit [Synergistetes bacterium]|nr:TRAP transporter fused permease subunit [Synergistota bacterium]MCX8128017.1 TRAP transporter fused permease subunit [Synergistota bacterium]MDW8192788.1 TRAP transporter fused permease subunit [Synergistota bacterium]
MRKLRGTPALWAMILAIFTSLLHIWMNSIGLTPIIERNIAHVCLLMALGFLYYPATAKSLRDRPSLLDWILSFTCLIIPIYFSLSYERIIKSAFNPSTLDFIYGISLMILVTEASRRIVGLPLTILSVFFLFYAYFGPYFPEPFSHQGYNLRRIIIRMTMTDEGIPGIALMVSSSYVFMFVMFSSFLRASGTSQFFNDFASALTGMKRGGPAKIAIIASALTGTINGSAQANVVTTGSFTIPLMIQTGYKPYFAAAVEAIASTGGIIMPPIMGAAAFIMSSFLGIPYLKIMYAGFIPAILYYFSLYQMVDLGALKWGLEGVPKNKLPLLKNVIRERGHMIIPLIVLIAALIMGFSPIISALFGLALIIAVGAIKSSTRLSLKDMINALYESAIDSISIAVVCAIVGYIIGVVGMTGIGQEIGYTIVKAAKGELWLTLILCMITAIILGMALPAAACYIITVTVAAPALLMIGIDPFVAHFFAFYFGTMSAVIPPVALTSYTAAAIAKAPPTKVAITGLGIGIAGFLIPYLYTYNPVLLLINFSWSSFILKFTTALICLYSMAISIIGTLGSKKTLPFYERGFFALASILMVPNSFNLNIIGITLFLSLYTINRFLKKEV